MVRLSLPASIWLPGLLVTPRDDVHTQASSRGCRLLCSLSRKPPAQHRVWALEDRSAEGMAEPGARGRPACRVHHTGSEFSRAEQLSAEETRRFCLFSSHEKGVCLFCNRPVTCVCRVPTGTRVLASPQQSLVIRSVPCHRQKSLLSHQEP